MEHPIVKFQISEHSYLGTVHLVDLLSYLKSETPDTIEVMTGNIYIKEVHKLAKIPQGADKVLIKSNY